MLFFKIIKIFIYKIKYSNKIKKKIGYEIKFIYI